MLIHLVLAVALADEGGPCPSGARDQLAATASRLETAWTQGDGATFDEAAARLDGLLACVDGLLSSVESARLHRARALVSFVAGDAEAARRSMVAARTLDPRWAPPADVVPAGHPLWKVYDAAEPPEEGAVVRFLARPAHGWAVDGTRFPLPARATAGRIPDDGLPADRAFVLQIFDPKGLPSWSGYHLSTATVPVDQLELGPDPSELRERRRRQARIWGSVVGGALLAGGGAAFGVGWNERSRLEAGEVPLTEVEATAAEANVLGGVSYGLAGAGALLVTLAWSVPW